MTALYPLVVVLLLAGCDNGRFERELALVEAKRRFFEEQMDARKRWTATTLNAYYDSINTITTEALKRTPKAAPYLAVLRGPDPSMFTADQADQMILSHWTTVRWVESLHARKP